MSSIPVATYAISAGVVSIGTLEPHGLSANDYISVRNVSSIVNGQYFILSTPNSNTINYSLPGAPNTGATPALSGYILTTTINTTGKPGYIYDSDSDTWYQLSGKVNTNANYTWTGTHLHEVPVTMEDILIFKNVSASVSASPSGGGFLFVENGALKFKGGNGTITTVAPA